MLTNVRVRSGSSSEARRRGRRRGRRNALERRFRPLLRAIAPPMDRGFLGLRSRVPAAPPRLNPGAELQREREMRARLRAGVLGGRPSSVAPPTPAPALPPPTTAPSLLAPRSASPPRLASPAREAASPRRGEKRSEREARSESPVVPRTPTKRAREEPPAVRASPDVESASPPAVREPRCARALHGPASDSALLARWVGRESVFREIAALLGSVRSRPPAPLAGPRDSRRDQAHWED